jgi:hypothetical protein
MPVTSTPYSLRRNRFVEARDGELGRSRGLAHMIGMVLKAAVSVRLDG